MCDVRNVGGRLLRCGCTTGSCAAAASKAAALLLLANETAREVSIKTPDGTPLTFRVAKAEKRGELARCAVQKDGGDDPDATNGLLVVASVSKTARGIRVDGGEGVGRVTKPGLDQPVGEAAINSVPRRMIADSVTEVCAACAYQGGLFITISIPGGERIAARTFNPRMGIEGGLSVIGTTGIVEPMSNKALVDTIRLELKQLAATGARGVLLTPGNYGETFARDELGLSLASRVVCSNFIGDAIDAAAELGFGEILLVGHIGKLVKLGIGMTNTHSSYGDGRMETLIACALKAGGRLSLLNAIADCVATDAALLLLYEADMLKSTMAILGERIDDCLHRRAPESVRTGYVCYTNAQPFSGIIAKSANAEEMMKLWRKQ